MGSPYYMAPEQWAETTILIRDRTFTVLGGDCFFRMLTGDVPFKGSSIPAIMKKAI
jgi:serine/threonine protein kinase